MRRAGRGLLTLLLNYKIVLAVVWVVSTGVWLVLQVLPASPESEGQHEAALTVIDDPTPTPTLVSETSSTKDKQELSPNEY